MDFVDTLKAILYAFENILMATDKKNLDAIKVIAKQEIKAVEYDLKTLLGEKK